MASIRLLVPVLGRGANEVMDGVGDGLAARLVNAGKAEYMASEPASEEPSLPGMEEDPHPEPESEPEPEPEPDKPKRRVRRKAETATADESDAETATDD